MAGIRDKMNLNPGCPRPPGDTGTSCTHLDGSCPLGFSSRLQTKPQLSRPLLPPPATRHICLQARWPIMSPRRGLAQTRVTARLPAVHLNGVLESLPLTRSIKLSYCCIRPPGRLQGAGEGPAAHRDPGLRRAGPAGAWEADELERPGLPGDLTSPPSPPQGSEQALACPRSPPLLLEVAAGHRGPQSHSGMRTPFAPPGKAATF